MAETGYSALIKGANRTRKELISVLHMSFVHFYNQHNHKLFLIFFSSLAPPMHMEDAVDGTLYCFVKFSSLLNYSLVSGWKIDERDLEIRENIGKGEFGDVMLGILSGKKVAVKILKDQSAASKFRAEASIMA